MPTGKPKARDKRRLGHGERLAIVAATAVNPSAAAVAKIFNVGLSTVKRLMNDRDLLAFSDGDFDQASRMMSTVMLANTARAQDHVTDEGLKKLNPVQLAIFSKINIEASRLLREKPTSISQHSDVTNLASTVMDRLKNSLDAIEAEIVPDSPDSNLLNDTTTHDKPSTNE